MSRLCGLSYVNKKAVIQISLADLNSVGGSSLLHLRTETDAFSETFFTAQNPQTNLRYSKLVVFITETVHCNLLHIRQWVGEHRCTSNKSETLDFQLSPCREYYILSFGWFSGIWILYADVSEHSVSSIFIGRANKIHGLWRWNRMFQNLGTNHPKERIKIWNCYDYEVWWVNSVSRYRDFSTIWANTVFTNATGNGWPHNRVDAAYVVFREIFSYPHYLQSAGAKLFQVKLKNLGNSQVTHCIFVTKTTCQCSTYTVL